LENEEAEKLAHAAFKLMDEIEAKERTLGGLLPAYEFVFRIEYLSSLLNETIADITDKMSFNKMFPKSDEVRSRLPKLMRNFFCFFLLVQVIAEQFENDQELLKDLRNREDVRSHLATWSKRPAVVIVLACRNILAHLRPFKAENMNVHRKIEDSGDHRVWVDYSLGVDDWTMIHKKINKVSDSAVKAEANLLLADLQTTNTNPGAGVLQPTYSILPLIRLATDETNQLLQKLRSSFDDRYTKELADRGALIEEIRILHEQLDKIAPLVEE